MTYQVGQVVKLAVKGIRQNSVGDKYICVVDDKYEYRIWEMIKCQEDGNLPDELEVVVKSVDQFGRAKMKQDVQAIYEEYYTKDEIYPFTVDTIQEDSKDNPFYLVSDDFSEQRFYIIGEQKYNIGDIINLRSKGRRNGFMQWEEFVKQEPIAIPTVTTGEVSVRRTNIAPYGPESIKVEYKSSIVFSAKNSEPNVQEQSKVIAITIASMMNSEGGVLAIGVRDDGTISGIQDDYKYLNDDPTCSFTYPLNEDGYKRKIVDKIKYHCSMLAAKSIKVDFKEKVGLRYCVVTIEPAIRPIWIKDGNNYELYVRLDGGRQQIKGEKITEYIYNRMQKTLSTAVGGAQVLATFDEERLSQLIRSVMNENKTNVILPERPKREIDWWIVWKNDDCWIRQREKSEDDDVFVQVPLYKNMSTPLVVFCYNTMNVVVRKYAEMNRGTKVNTYYEAGWTPGLTPLNTFIVEPTDYLCIHSVDYHGVESIKMHSMTDFSAIKTLGAQGAAVLPPGSKILSYGIIGAEYKAQLNGLILSKNERSRVAGTPINTQNAELAKAVNIALALIKK